MKKKKKYRISKNAVCIILSLFHYMRKNITRNKFGFTNVKFISIDINNALFLEIILFVEIYETDGNMRVE